MTPNDRIKGIAETTRDYGSIKNSRAVASGGLSADHPEWFIQVVEAKRSFAMVCFPYAGAGNAVFSQWKSTGFDAAEVWATQLPGRDARLREPPIESAEEMADRIFDALKTQPLYRQPVALFGCSFGGVLAFEVARRMRDDGKPVEALAVAACRAPQALDVTKPVAHLPDDEMVEKLQHWYRAIPPEVVANQSMLELMLPTLRADMKVYETYQYDPQPPLECPLYAFGSTDDTVVDLNRLNAWNQQTTGKFIARQFSGDHFFMKSNPGPVLKFLQRRLGQVESS